ncbi:MAG: membrane protein insertion efficiency factor YidD [Candidatus Zhuqueibacterota bacterium]
MKYLLMAIIKFYQKAISPFFLPSCRFIPTCSEYSYQAINKYGIFKGLALAVWRILRCNPFNKGGDDPLV